MSLRLVVRRALATTEADPAKILKAARALAAAAGWRVVDRTAGVTAGDADVEALAPREARELCFVARRDASAALFAALGAALEAALGRELQKAPVAILVKKKKGPGPGVELMLIPRLTALRPAVFLAFIGD